MNGPVILLDTSLRDGGHRTNFNFTDTELKEILQPLDTSGIEYLEIGYRNGSLAPIDIGRAGWCAKEYLIFCRSLVKQAKIAVMIYPNNVTQNDLNELKECGIDLLRICIPKGELESALPKIKMARIANMNVAINLTHTSCYKEYELDEVMKQIHDSSPDIIYFADSNGSFLPPQVKSLYDRYMSIYPKTSFGFHAHDNLGLAQANALAALSAGVRFIDVTLAGMGRGIGNLKTEFFVASLHSIQLKKYNLENILKAANFVRHSLKIGHEPIEISEFLRGISNPH
ncbi:4-hydroxy-2-oxovalerate aldolase [Legionella longbeachae]|uniref:Putative 4-hydroxy-2-oxovalerate aldolase n=1 Tax=Legionella longbeachae serogroup 1 (strain NSW150) TaxID=661367 RepID=D3HP81_LEGLN|nr:4-hydroxy-2-oxovalerate aldolase [Legionella longbeachae]VEE01221.1 4-hydroxy-2-oxovalerate aldolase [Legionella oakridgensis]HBD7398340.1 4-hydroxy-2-oxovalerate aldolase [Legionella pneumophila]ARB92409.1 4-hydroxy-2-oxovalerate aldolase [Legionella longbeachae]EEZ96302.1 4-hydroxy-2-oxovalerate aldolase-like protein [Legionella longbeachae D-4968]QIN31171.1 4-hydroxy-2-oxovalerate aldolase [Legionella longbeachae]